MPTPTLSSTTHALLSVTDKQVWIKAPVVAFLVGFGFHVAFKQSLKVLSKRLQELIPIPDGVTCCEGRCTLG